MDDLYRVTRVRESYIHVLADSVQDAEAMAKTLSLFDDSEDVVYEVFATRDDVDELGKYDYVWDEVEQEWLAPEELQANLKEKR
jgi:hypothetical protein